MRTLAKIIKRLLFGPSLEDYEARQRAENVKAVQRINSTSATKPAMSIDERRAADVLSIVRIQADLQTHIAKQQAKGILNYRSDNDGSISVRA